MKILDHGPPWVTVTPSQADQLQAQELANHLQRLPVPHLTLLASSVDAELHRLSDVRRWITSEITEGEWQAARQRLALLAVALELALARHRERELWDHNGNVSGHLAGNPEDQPGDGPAQHGYGNEEQE